MIQAEAADAFEKPYLLFMVILFRGETVFSKPDGFDSFDDGSTENKLEDVRMSNFAFSQTKVSEFISFYFAAIGVGCAIIASEMSN